MKCNICNGIGWVWKKNSETRYQKACDICQPALPFDKEEGKSVSLVWITPDAEKMIGYMARVSNPSASINDDTSKLISYLIKNEHWSPLEMANMCLDISTQRDVGRQLLRHRSFVFQEFSQRYQDVGKLEVVPYRIARMQDQKNRQNSVECDDDGLIDWWLEKQTNIREWNYTIYEEALKRGIAKEVARTILPEGLTPTRMYMNGSIRSWIHFCSLRMGHGTQKETISIARQCWSILRKECPSIVEAWEAVSAA
jgi:thymidylate synthase (FAD)